VVCDKFIKCDQSSTRIIEPAVFIAIYWVRTRLASLHVCLDLISN